MFALPKRSKEWTIPLSAAMLAEIDDHEDRFLSVAATLPWQRADGEPMTARLLMTGEGGRLYSDDLFTKVVWHGAFRAAGIEYRGRADGMHALLHFYASTLLARAVSIAELADSLVTRTRASRSGRTRTSSRRATGGSVRPSMRCSDGLLWKQ